MRIAVFDTHPYDEQALTAANLTAGHTLEFFEERLHDKTVELARGFDAVCPFVNCHLSETVLQGLTQMSVKLVVLRAAESKKLSSHFGNSILLRSNTAQKDVA